MSNHYPPVELGGLTSKLGLDMDSVDEEKYAALPKRWSPPPIVIFLAVCTLTVGTLLGAIASLTLYNFPSATAGVGTCQSLTLISVCILP